MKEGNYTSFSLDGTLKLVYKPYFYWVEESKEEDPIKEGLTEERAHICL